jgi:imidazolonepropionase
VEDELKQLRVYRLLQADQPLEIVLTLLGAHTVPPKYENDRAGYQELVRDEMIPRMADENLAEFCDAFVEESAFAPDEARALFDTAREHGIRPKLHADQLTDTGGAALAAEVDAASADHLECISEDGIGALANSDTVAVSLPLATLYLDEFPLPARALRDAGVPIAVATDFNPGSAPSYHLPLMVTFDLDALDQTHAPGVSAPAAGGLFQDLWLHAAYRAGRSPKVASIDVVELNPNVDVDDRTVRLAALPVMEILRGLTDRLHRG